MKLLFAALGFFFAGAELYGFVLSTEPGKSIKWGHLLMGLLNLTAGIYLLT